MQETQVQSFVSHIKKRRHISRGVQDVFEEAAKVVPGIANNNLNKLLRIKHRRKYQPIQDKKIGTPTWKNKYLKIPFLQERLSHKSSTSQNEQSQKNIHSQNGCSSERQRSTKSRFSIMSKPSGSKLKYPLRKQEHEDKESPKLNKFVLKCEKKLSECKNKTLYQQPLNRIKKVPTFANRTTSTYDNYFQQEPFINLISKFRFQNLKKDVEQSYQFKNKIQGLPFSATSKKPFYRGQRGTFQQELNGPRKEKKKMNQTMTKMVSIQGKSSKKLTRRISILSPWQNDTNEMGSTHELL